MRENGCVLIFFIVLIVGIGLSATGTAQEVRAGPRHAGFLLAASSGHLIQYKVIQSVKTQAKHLKTKVFNAEIIKALVNF